MPYVDLDRLTEGLPRAWAGLLRDWDRSLRATNYPTTTRYVYLLAVSQLAAYLAQLPDAAEAAEDPTQVTRRDVEAFQAWMVETRSAATALNKHTGLQQFFAWLVDDEREMERSPMERVKRPKIPTKLVPVIDTDETKVLLELCKGKGFLSLRDQALIRLYANTGARLSEVANLRVDDVDLTTDSVRLRGKGGKERRVRLGTKTARALSRYLRARAKHSGSHLPQLWLAERGGHPLLANGIKIRLRKLGARAGLQGVHAHRWRHAYAHEWKRAGGDTGDLMLVMGWSSDAMPRHYGASAAAERAQEVQRRMGIGDV